MAGVASSRPRAKPLVLFAYGFRPFFLLAGLYGAFAVPLWLGLYTGWIGLEPALPPTFWHGHEMLFGYATAVLAGFLLTATPGWGDTDRVRGWWLAALVALWLGGRLGVTFGGAAPRLAALIDLAFLPAVALAVAPALQESARRNLVFLPLLAVLALANLLVHLDALGLVQGFGSLALVAALDLFALMIGLVGGRIVPAFTANALKAKGSPVVVRPFGVLDRLAIASLVAVLLTDVLGLAPLAGAVALLAAFLNGLRMRGWATSSVLREPILWILHLGFAWLVIGLGWKGLVELLAFAPPSAALHGLAVGTVGTMTLGVMSRAALGHTGRQLRVPAQIVASYVLVSFAALVRLIGELLPDQLQLSALLVAGLLWTTAFAIFTVVYAPVLTRPRQDSRPS